MRNLSDNVKRCIVGTYGGKKNTCDIDSFDDDVVRSVAKDLRDNADNVLFQCWCNLVVVGGKKYLKVKK